MKRYKTYKELVKDVLEYQELHNGDEVGIDNQWDYDDAEYHYILEFEVECDD